MNIDALLPPEIAKRAETVGARKCRLPFWPLLTLAILAGAFICPRGDLCHNGERRNGRSASLWDHPAAERCRVLLRPGARRCWWGGTVYQQCPDQYGMGERYSVYLSGTPQLEYRLHRQSDRRRSYRSLSLSLPS